MRAMIDDELVRAHRDRALSPDHPVLRGIGAESRRLLPGARSRSTPYYLACPTIVQNVMDKFAKIVGRQYHLFDYVGAPDAERVIIMMGSGAEAAHETVDSLAGRRARRSACSRCGSIRPFSVETLPGGAACHREDHRRTRPHQGAGRHRRAALSAT